ncbi:hypothetical protein ASG76_13865 [Nocardioides sp. Soil774]|uniref:hypothetical protein n=1 Tax=Nocardioides sp. Soil774 TaxID=1736408 RepID=UPI000702018F|nr:hypothetical protein [Nocardioides sp. Soil774]KRE93534.1 hypothetical protein ASG76_13865 [Nocardioides sp. Soil774]
MQPAGEPDPTADPAAAPPAGTAASQVASEAAYVEGVHLRRTDENVREIEALAAVLGDPAGLSGLLGDLKWPLRRSRAPRLLGRAVREAWRWDAYDERDVQWYPQGISTSADASDAEVVDGRRVVVATWYSTGRDGVKRGSRVTFADLDSGRYRHVLLVSPVLDETGTLVLRPLNVHAGGIVWAGPYLHVAATGRGFVTARVDDIMRVPGDDDHPDELGLDGTRLHAFGHRYVLPVRSTHKAFTDEGHEKLRYSFMSLDRHSDPPALVAGEYAASASATTRLARYPLDPATGELATGDDGFSRPLALDDGGVRQMQGAVLAAGRFHVTVSHGPWMPGSVWSGQPGSMTERRWALPMGPEDLSYWPSTDRLWSVTEHPRRRWIVSMDRAWFDR